VFALYKKQYTRVNLNIVRSEHSRSLEAVFNRDVDFAVVSLPLKDSRLVIQPIHRDDIVLVVAPTHPLAMREIVKLDEMMQFPMLLLKHGRQRTQLDNFFHHHEVQPRIAMELESSELLKRLICAEMGMGFLPLANVRDDEHSGLLKIVKVEGMKLHRELALIFRKDKTLTRAAQAFLEIASARNGPSAYPPMRIPKGSNLARGA
jgi:DNA-binding transcriptional LysR family regulator